MLLGPPLPLPAGSSGFAFTRQKPSGPRLPSVDDGRQSGSFPAAPLSAEACAATQTPLILLGAYN